MSIIFLVSFPLQPEEFEAVHSHTFRLKTFKKGKHCGVCKQTVNNEGLICRGQSRGGWTACGASCTRDICPSQHLMRANGKKVKMFVRVAAAPSDQSLSSSNET